MSQLLSEVLPSVGANVRELKVTGFFCGVWQFPFFDEDEPKTLSPALLELIKATCPELKALVIRKCNLERYQKPFQDYLPGSLQTLEFHDSR